MKIVHVSTYDTGGAATSALRLHKGLLKQGTDSVFFCLHKTSDYPPNKIQFTQASAKRTIGKRIKNRLGFYDQSQKEKNLQSISRLEGSYENFSFPLTSLHVEAHSLLKEADIIHLHWVADYISYPGFFEHIKKPIVWTLHDMNPFSGGFHYGGDEERNESFKTIDREVREIKRAAIAACQKLAIVTPSKWLGEAAKASEMFGQSSFSQVPYGLDLSVFKLHDKEFARNVFNLPQDKKIFLFVSETINNYRKGFDLVAGAIEALNTGDEYIMVTVGKTNLGLVKKDHIYNMGVINDERLMSLLYSAADLFVLPSREDNFPNVMLEALSCGTPVLSFKTGGMAEEIEPGMNGFFADDITPASLAKAIKDFDGGKYVFDRNAIRNAAMKKFALELQADAYLQVYKKITGNIS